MTTSTTPSKRSKRSSNSDNDSFAAVQLSIQRPGHKPQTLRLCFHSGWPSFYETISLHFDGRDDDDGNTPRDANATGRIGLGDATGIQGSVRCMLLSPDSESVHNGGCCLQDSPPASSSEEAETQHPELKRRRPGTSNSKTHQADDGDGEDDGDDGEITSLLVKRRRCSLGSSARSPAPVSASTPAPEHNYLVHLGLVKLYPTEHDVILNRLQPSVIHRTQDRTPQQRLLWSLASLLRRFANLTRLRAIPLRVAACAALVVGLAVLLRVLPHLPLTRVRPSRQGQTHDAPPPPSVRHLNLLALYSANLVRYASVPRVLSLGLAAGRLHGSADHHIPEPPAFACNSAGHFVPEEYFLSDLRLVLPDIIWDLRRNSGSTAGPSSSSAEDSEEDRVKTAQSLAALQGQVSSILSRLAILNGRIRALPKNWSSDVFLTSSSRLLELVEIRKREPDFTALVKCESSETTPLYARRDLSRLAKDADVPESFSSAWATYMTARSEQRSASHTPTPLDGINHTHESLLEMAGRPLVTVNLDFSGETAPGRNQGYARVPREQVLVLYAAVLEEACALLSDVIARVNHTVAVVPDPVPPNVALDEGMRSLVENPSQYGIARIHRAAPFLHSIALVRLADMRDRARSAVLVLRNVVAQQLPVERGSSSINNGTVPGSAATFPGWPVIAVDVESAHQWIRIEYDNLNLATKMRQVSFMAGVDEIESENKDGRTPEGLVWSRWHMEDDREDPYMRERLFWWQRQRQEVPGRRKDGGALGKVPGVIRNLFS